MPSHVWRACLSARTSMNCVLVDLCGRARLRVCRCACVRARARVCACLLIRLCARACTACVTERFTRACASRLHAPCHRTAATCSIYSSARTTRCDRARLVAFGATGRACARVGCRGELDEPHGQRAVGWPRRAHVRGRRRRRHLRHRRRRRRPHLLQRRVGEHRRRCTAGLSLGVVGGVLDGGTRGGAKG
jgi:hypothetical protein